MNVLFQSRKTLFSVPGGDTIQVLKTAEALRLRGCNVDISTEIEPDVSGYDIVHVFNLARPQELYLQILNAKKKNKKVALSSIYVSYSAYDRHSRGGVHGFIARKLSQPQVEYLKIASRAVFNRELNKGTLHLLQKGYRKLQNAVLQMSDILLPNSMSEMKRITKDFPDHRDLRCAVIPNGIDTSIFRGTDVRIPEELGQYNGCILCVARIEGPKNQLNLVRALKGLPWKLLIVGEVAPNHREYMRRLRREAGANTYFLGHVAHDELPGIYKLARVHALPSWGETTGLASLEAAAMSCNLVITAHGDTRDYFRNHAFYCRPDDIESIRSAITRAYNTPFISHLRDLIRDEYTWEKAAAKTLEAYKSIM